MQSIAAQTRQPDEVVIVDGGSSDNTVEYIRRYESKLRLKIIVEPGANISRGRNIAIREADGDIIAITDAGVWLEPEWLERITAPLLADESVGVACGFFLADPRNTFEAALGATTLPLANEIDADSFLPSSRSVALRAEFARRIGGYPEWLDYCEDLIFDLRLKKLGVPFVFVADAVAHFRPRPTLEAYFKQYYLYARGDGKANLWLKRHIIRYVTYLVVIPLIYLLGAVLHEAFWLLYFVGAAVYLYRPYRRLPVVLQMLPQVTLLHGLAAALMVPVIRVVGDVAKMFGYPAGVKWRLAHNPPDWRRLTLRSVSREEEAGA